METWKQTDGFGRVREKVNGNFAASAGLLAELKAGKAEVVYGMYTGTGTEGAVPVELGFRPRAVIACAHGGYNSGGTGGVHTMISISASSCEFIEITETGFIASKYMCYAQSNSNPYRYLAFR